MTLFVYSCKHKLLTKIPVLTYTREQRRSV